MKTRSAPRVPGKPPAVCEKSFTLVPTLAGEGRMNNEEQMGQSLAEGKRGESKRIAALGCLERSSPEHLPS